jgi:outer membrane protein assembly factor BamB
MSLMRPPANFPRHRLTCLAFTLVTLVLGLASARADDWPQWLGPQRDGVWREKGILRQFPEGGPRIRWRTSIQGGYAGPAIANGKVYVTDRVLDPGESDPDNPFRRSNSRGKERVLCLDEATGKILWTHDYPCTYRISYGYGPRTTPVVHEGKVYTLGAMGNLVCLDGQSGNPVWTRDFMKDYGARTQQWGFAAHPLIDGNKLICLVGGEGSVAVAFNKDTGKEIWRALTSEVGQGYCPPMIYEAGGKRQLIIWHPQAVASLDPETGKTYWTVPFRARANLSIPTPRLDDNHLFVTSFYNGSLMLELSQDRPAARELWRSHSRSERPEFTTKLHSIMCTPYMKDGYIYGVCSYGQLRCLEVKTGKRVWSTLKATCPEGEPVRWANAFLIPHEDRFFLFNEKGDLIIARLTPKGYEEIDRAHILEPTAWAGRKVVWSHPAFANRCMYARNDKEIVCVDLSAK